MPHKLRKTRKKRGSRTQGYGQVGQHRKSGAKGRRKSGYDKQGWTYIVKYEPDYYGKRGFLSPRSRGTNIINVGEIEELASKLAIEQDLEKKDGKSIIDLDNLGYDKLLAKGRIALPLIVSVSACSKAAAKKIEEAGGKVFKKKSIYPKGLDSG